MTDKNRFEDSIIGKISIASSALTDILTYKLPPGPAFIPLNWIVNTQKFGTWILMLGLMIYYDNWSKGCWMYVTLHGSYGITWFIKDLVFPDKSFQVKVPFTSAIIVGAVLAMYLLP
jgi:hypothetical protein